MPIWMGIDLGDARVGIALSDPELILAHPRGNIKVPGDSFYALEDVIDAIEEENVERVFVGYPLLLNGEEGKSKKKAKRWVKALLRKLEENKLSSVKAELCDERLTTVSAHSMLLEAGMSMRSHRSAVDQQSAVILLQEILDRNKCAETDGSVAMEVV